MDRPCHVTFSRKERGTLPCEMIKPNLIASHDWHVQPNCQRSLRAIRLSETLGSRPEPKFRMSSNLMRNADCVCLYCRLRRFGANFSKLSEAWLPVKRRIASNHHRQPVRTAQNIKYQPAKIARAARARGRLAPGSCNGLFSLGIPYRGLTVRSRITSNPTNQVPLLSFPLPSHRIHRKPCIDRGRPFELSSAHSRQGHREAQLLTYCFIRVAQVPHRCKHTQAAKPLYLQHLETFSNRFLRCGQDSPVETLSFLWETTAWGSLKSRTLSIKAPNP